MFRKSHHWLWSLVLLLSFTLGMVLLLPQVSLANTYQQILEKSKAVYFNQGGTVLVNIYYDEKENYVELWNASKSDFTLIRKEEMQHWLVSSAWNFAVSADGRMLARRSPKGDQVLVMDLSGKLISSIDVPHWTGAERFALAFTPDNQYLFCGLIPSIELEKGKRYTEKKFILIKNLKTGALREHEIADYYADPVTLTVSYDGKYLSTYGWHGYTGQGRLHGINDQTKIVKPSNVFGLSIYSFKDGQLQPVIQGFQKDYHTAQVDEKIDYRTFTYETDHFFYAQGGKAQLIQLDSDKPNTFERWAKSPVDEFSQLAVGPHGRYLFYIEEDGGKVLAEYQLVNSQFKLTQKIQWAEEKKPKDLVYNGITGEWLVAGWQDLYRIQSKGKSLFGKPGSALAEAQELLEVGFTGEAVTLIKKAIQKEPMKDIFRQMEYFYFLYEKYNLTMQETGELLRAHLEALLQDEIYYGIGITPDVRSAPYQMGGQISKVRPGSPADRAGITSNCSIQKLNQKHFSVNEDWPLIYSGLPGSTVDLTLYNSDRNKLFDVTVQLQVGYRDQLRFDLAVQRLMDYAMLAGKAGQPERLRQAAQLFRELKTKYPLSADWQRIGQVDLLWEAYAIALEKDPDAAYQYLLEHGRLVEPGANSYVNYYVVKYASLWAPIYQDKEKLAYFIGVPSSQLPDIQVKKYKRVEYPPLGDFLGSLDVTKVKSEIPEDLGETNEDLPEFFKLLTEGSVAEIRTALDFGADVNQTHSTMFDVYAPLQWAIMKNRSPEVIKLLLDAGAQPTYQDFMGNVLTDLVIYNTHPGNLELLIGAGAKLEQNLIPNAANPAMSIEISKEMISVLLGYGQDVNGVDVSGNSALFYACQKNNLEIAKFLLESGADPNLPNNKGVTPFLEAVQFAELELVQLLLEHGADPLAIDHEDRTSLILAAKANTAPEVCSILVSGGVSFEAEDSLGRNALHYAATYNQSPEIVRYLLDEVKMNPAQVDQNNQTPYLMALLNQGRSEVIAELVRLGGNIISVDLYQDLPRNMPPVIKFSDDGNKMATVLQDQFGWRIRVWQGDAGNYFLTATDLLIQNSSLTYDDANLAFAPNGQALYYRLPDNRIAKVDVASGTQKMLELKGLPTVTENPKIPLAVNHSGYRLASIYQAEEGYVLTSWNILNPEYNHMIQIPFDVAGKANIQLNQVEYFLSDQYYLVSGEKYDTNNDLVGKFALVYEIRTGKLINVIDFNDPAKEIRVTNFVLESLADQVLVQYERGEKDIVAILTLNPYRVGGIFYCDGELIADSDGGNYLMGSEMELSEYGKVFNRYLPIVKRELGEGLTPLALAYDSKYGRWVVVCQNEIRFIDPMVEELDVAKQAVQAQDLARAGFTQQAMAEATAAIQANPYLLIYRDGQYYATLAQEGLPLGDVGKLILQQYQLVQGQESIVADQLQENCLLDYAVLAVQAGHPKLARQALERLGNLYQSRDGMSWPSQYKLKLVEVLIIAAESGVDAAYSQILEKGIFDGDRVLLKDLVENPDYWRLLYSKPKKLAYLLNMSVDELPEVEVGELVVQDYPAF